MNVELDPVVVQDLDLLSDPGAERAVLSCIFKNPNIAYDVFCVLAPEDFQVPANRNVASIVLAIIEGRYPNISTIDLVSLAEIASRMGVLEEIGGAAYFHILQDTPVSPDNLNWYVEQVKTYAVKRQIYLQSLQTKEYVKTNNMGTADDVVGKVTQDWLDLCLGQWRGASVQHISDSLDDVMAEKLSRPPGIIGVPTGFKYLDDEISGLRPQCLHIVFANSKAGKSSLLLNIGLNVARQGIPVFYVDTEMTIIEHQYRAISNLSGVPEKKIINGNIGENDELDRVMKAVDELHHIPLYYESMLNFRMHYFRSSVRKMKFKDDIGLLLFDWIKVPADKEYSSKDDWKILGEVSNSLKQIAKELQIPVLAAAQLNRAAIGKTEINASFAAGSYEVIKYADTLMYYRKKTDKEIEEHGSDNGNMILQIGETRSFGEYIGWLDFQKEVHRVREIRNVALSADAA